MAATWGLLDGKGEDELHKSRLLNVEEKPFKRITKRLNTLYSVTTARARQAPTPPPETTNGTPLPTNANTPAQVRDDETPAPGDSSTAAAATDLVQLREDVTLDFAAFDSSIARLQFLLTANERERERYAAERERIVAASQAVRDNTSRLRGQLDEARATLAQRREFDALADAITSNPSLRTRTEQASNLQKLEDEIAELEAEREAYGVTWHDRREQFAVIMDESMRLRRLIRDEKEEVERREGMDDDEAAGTPRPSGMGSREGTPRPETGLIPKSGVESGDLAGTPRPLSVGGRTPARESPAPSQSFIAKRAVDMGTSFSQVGSQIGSQIGSRMGSRDASTEPETRSARAEMEGEEGEGHEEGEEHEEDAEREEGEDHQEGEEHEEGGDVEMGEAKEEEEDPDSPLSPPPADDTPHMVVDEDADAMDTT